MYEDIAFLEVTEELARATAKFGVFASPHEGLAILQEEFEELKAQVFNKPWDFEQMRKEAIQTAAMAIRFLVDIC